MRKWFFIPPLLLIISGFLYQTLSNSIEARDFPEPGKLVDAGGMKLKLNCTGKGGRTVILESGLGDVLTEWRRVQPEIAKFARVCSYDRAGYGGSDPGPMPRTSRQIATELHALLQNAGERPPYLLVGHSFGGYNVRVFNGRYRDEVAALILVDAVQEDQYDLLPGAWKTEAAAMLQRYRRQSQWAPVFINLGLARLTLRSQGALNQDSYLILQQKYVKARASELESIRVSAEQARAADHISDKRLIVLTAGKQPDRDFERIWVDNLQMRLTHLSMQGKRLILTNTGHDIPNERPDAIINAIRTLL